MRGNGKGFSAGIDLNAFFELPAAYGPDWQRHMREITEEFQALLNSLAQVELPTIAVLHGFALGLGLELALACDLRLAAEGALLGLPEARLGIVPDVGGSTRLAQAVGLVRAKELIFTGRQIDAALAERWGLVNQVAPADQLDAALDGLLAEITQCAPLAVGMAKRLLNGMFDTPRGLALEGWAQSQLIATQDFGEGVQAMLQRRPAQFQTGLHPRISPPDSTPRSGADPRG
ncbi:enoyl-CoA hydratase/isomerase family protein [Candidatus Amarolinea dominans]|uniref:enoyl-CoA hydratase/isomerase family protein n=1 Tax=Candidatus Amarolinea dominans TaxID=3140696 RepID=UPI001D51E779|nr:enoyl-CoA hydratase/isomerase family protein [Anaerolineae bacterium]